MSLCGVGVEYDPVNRRKGKILSQRTIKAMTFDVRF